MTDLAVQLCGVAKTYRHFTLDDIDIKLPTGSIMGFIAAKGTGKSTTIPIVMGLARADRGAVTVLDYPIPEYEASAKLDIAFVSDDMRLYKAETLAWYMRSNDRSGDRPIMSNESTRAFTTRRRVSPSRVGSSPKWNGISESCSHAWASSLPT